MNKPQRIAFASVAGYIITAVGILGIGLTVVPVESRSHLFWPRVLWTEFLALLLWGTVFSFLHVASRREETGREIIGVLPGAKLVLIVYAGLSFLVMIGHAYMPETDIASRIHLVLQIALAVLAGILFAFLSISASSAAVGLERTFDVGLSPTDLCVMLQEQETRVHQFPTHAVWHQFEKSLKALRESIRYSIPHVGSIGATTEYRDFAHSVNSVCDDLSSHSDPTDAELGPIQEGLNRLLSKVKALSSQSIRR